MGFEESTEFERYGIRAVPQMVVTDGEGNEIGRIGGLAGLHREGRLATAVAEQAAACR